MSARPQRPAARLLTVGFDSRLDRTHHDHDPAQASTFPERDDRFLVNATFVRGPSIGGERSRTQQLTDTTAPIERLHWMAEKCPRRQASEAGVGAGVIHKTPGRRED